jgi:hypothetical protein
VLGAAGLLVSGCPDQALSTFNADPVATILGPEAGAAAVEGEGVLLRGQVTDSNDGPASLVASWYAGDAVLCEGAAPDDEGLTACEWTADLSGAVLRLEVIDDRGAAGVDTVTLAVTPNSAPSVGILLPTGTGPYYAGSLVEFDGFGSDVEDPISALAGAWTSGLDGLLAIGPALSVDGHSRGAVTLSEGQHFVEFTVLDTGGRAAVATVILDVGPPREEPSAVILAPLDGAVYTRGDTLTLEGVVADGQEAPDALRVSWTSSVDGLLSDAPADSAGRTVFTTTSLSAGEHVVTLEVVDGDGNRITDDVDFRVNGPPSQPTVVLDPAEPTTTDDLVAGIGAPSLDPDGDAITYTWAWFRDGVASGASTTERLPASATAKGEEWTAQLTPNDGITDGPAGRASVVILNTAPEVTALSFTPAAPLTDDLLTAASSTYDEDGDSVSVSYQWSVDGAVAGTGSTLAGASAFAKAQEIILGAVPNDGEEDGAGAWTASVTVGNTPPDSVAVSVLPASPAAGVDDLVCMVSATDADGDPLTWTITWTVDGVPYGGAETTVEGGDTVSAEDLMEGEEWACSATVTDGEDTAGPGTSSVVVGACPYGEAASCPADSCAELVSLGSSTDGRYWIDPDGAGALEVWCDATHDGGGWALVAVASDDGLDTWTYTARRYWDLDSTTFGSLDTLNSDFKSAALHRVLMSEVLTVHQPSGTWAAYPDVGDGTSAFSGIIAGYGDAYCWRSANGYEMGAGSLVATGGLCDTELYLNAADHDGGGGSCSCAGCLSNAHGPSWSVNTGDGCPFDGAGAGGSMGPDSNAAGESTSAGYGAALGINAGTPGAGENAIWVLVR